MDMRNLHVRRRHAKKKHVGVLSDADMWSAHGRLTNAAQAAARR